MASPLVTIIIPTCDRSWWLEMKSIPSVLNQTYHNLEIIIIDDGVHAAKKILEILKGSNFKYFKTKRPYSGPSVARNIGLNNCSGKYINFLDDDDEFDKSHIFQLVSFLETSNYRIAYTDAYRVHYEKVKEGIYKRCEGFNENEIPHSNDFSKDLFRSRNLTPILCVMFEKNCLKLSGIFDEKLRSHEDWDFWVRLANSYDFHHIKKPTCTVSWRTDGSTLTSNPSGEFKKYCGLAVQKIRKY